MMQGATRDALSNLKNNNIDCTVKVMNRDSRLIIPNSIEIEASFLRPDDLTAYADSDSISDDIGPNPLVFQIPNGKQDNIYSIDNIYIQRHSGNGVDISIFTLFMNLFVNVPPQAIADNSPFGILDNDSSNWIGEFSFSSQHIFGRNTVMRNISPSVSSTFPSLT